MSQWFRVYAELIDDPKFIKLGPDLRSALLMTWCVAAANGGRLPSLEDIAIKFRLSEARTEKLLDELRRSGFIDDDESGSEPHNWKGRQYKTDKTDPTNAARQRRYREKHSKDRNSVTDGDDNNDAITPHSNDRNAVTDKRPDTEAEQIQNRIKQDAANAAPIDLEKEVFRQGKLLLGAKSGGLINKLVKLRGTQEALDLLSLASRKEDPKEWIGGCLNKGNSDLRDRGDAW